MYWLNNINFKNIVWFIDAISYFVMLRNLGNLNQQEFYELEYTNSTAMEITISWHHEKNIYLFAAEVISFSTSRPCIWYKRLALQD